MLAPVAVVAAVASIYRGDETLFNSDPEERKADRDRPIRGFFYRAAQLVRQKEAADGIVPQTPIRFRVLCAIYDHPDVTPDMKHKIETVIPKLQFQEGQLYVWNEQLGQHEPRYKIPDGKPNQVKDKAPVSPIALSTQAIPTATPMPLSQMVISYILGARRTI